MALFGEPGARIGYAIYEGPSVAAPPLLLLHGFTASAASFDANLAGLRSHFRVITVELLGHGDSDAPDDPALYAPEPAVARILGLIDELGYQRVLLCGHSLGGSLALRLALDAPQRLSGLVVINSNSAAGDAEWLPRARQGMQQMAARIRSEGTAFMKNTRLYPASSRRLDERTRELLTRDFDRLTTAGVAGTAESLVVESNCFERLGELAVPTLVVLGDRDADFVANAPAFVARLPQDLVRTARLVGAGHAANVEQPEEFERALVGFAAELGIVDAPEAPRPSRGGFGNLAVNVIGVGLVLGGIALLAAALMSGRGGGTTFAAPPADTATPSAVRTVVSAVDGVRTGGPGLSAQALSSASPALSTGTAAPTTTAAPATATPVVPTATPRAATPTLAPTATPTAASTATASATASPSAVASPTASGPAAGIGGGGATDAGSTLTFTDVSSPGGNVQTRAWSVSGNATIVDQVNPAAIRVRFPADGCYNVSLTVTFRGQSAAFATSRVVAVGVATCS